MSELREEGLCKAGERRWREVSAGPHTRANCFRSAGGAKDGQVGRQVQRRRQLGGGGGSGTAQRVTKGQGTVPCPKSHLSCVSRSCYIQSIHHSAQGTASKEDGRFSEGCGVPRGTNQGRRGIRDRQMGGEIGQGITTEWQQHLVVLSSCRRLRSTVGVCAHAMGGVQRLPQEPRLRAAATCCPSVALPRHGEKRWGWVCQGS